MILMMIQTHRGGFPVVPEVGSLGRGEGGSLWFLRLVPWGEGVVLNDPDDDPNTPRRTHSLWRGRGLVE